MVVIRAERVCSSPPYIWLFRFGFIVLIPPQRVKRGSERNRLRLRKLVLLVTLILLCDFATLREFLFFREIVVDQAGNLSSCHGSEERLHAKAQRRKEFVFIRLIKAEQ
jgi:hypothetical protein